MPQPRVLVTDYAWPSLDIERGVLETIGATLLVAETGEEAELVELAPQADAILTCWKPVTPAVLDTADRCVMVSRYGVGLDNIAVDHATKLGMLVTNVPDFCLDEVSDHAMALLLACARRTGLFARATRSGTWDLSAGRPIPRLRGQTVGLLGFGNIGRTLVPKAKGFAFNVIAFDPYVPAEAFAELDVERCEREDVLRRSDYVSIHLPLTPETRGLVDESALRLMKSTAYLINTSRGPIINEEALQRALTEGWIAGAGLDVLVEEPPSPAHPLLAFDNVVATPHAAFYSETAIEELQRKAAENAAQVLDGELPVHIVNRQVMEQGNYRLKARDK